MAGEGGVDRFGSVAAGEYSAALAVEQPGYQVCCEARAFGQLRGGNWNIGIWLALPEADELASLIADA
jgi:hypothetical protein